MLWRSASKHRVVCALTIADSVVTGLAVVRSRTGYDILACDTEVLANCQPDTVSAALKQVHRRVSGRERRVITALKPSLSMQKQISLPGDLSPAGFSQALTAHYQRCFNGTDLFIDHEILGKSPDKPEQIAVRIVAARKPDVLNLEALFQQVGLKLLAVDTVICALERATSMYLHEQGIDSETNAIIVLQTDGLLFGVHNGRRFIYTRQEHLAQQSVDMTVQLINRCWQLFASTVARRQLQQLVLFSENEVSTAVKSQLETSFSCPICVAESKPWVNIGLVLGDYLS